ncbi:hypothetical protein DICVIV_14155 [Dictyocaulus viviparus]|uniref:Uncharacterized protein n=1 Tax=Dictyocaulus viviparus TaxID=29172 RepID=A0A0D8X820_DICVI|nr:hypothetical protein DICVIV_14155 [Dictyocaulus viviparus]
MLLSVRLNDKVNCLVTGNTVTSSCDKMDMAACGMQNNMKSIPPQHLTLSGTLKIGNLIMATWSNQMWRTILNRVLRVLSSGPFGMNFQAASVDIS